MIPNMIYGTAWKKEKSKDLILKALGKGFRAIDTANQPKHYVESATGDAWVASDIPRKELFLQTKFTYEDGQDENIPYDASLPYAEQVAESFASSLKHLQTDYVDSLVLHGPSVMRGLSKADVEVWGAMEELHKSGKVKELGVSNVSPEQLIMIYEGATIKPKYVQNRCYSWVGWDKFIRDYCKEKDMIYQGINLLTANKDIMDTDLVKGLGEKYDKTPEQIIYIFSKNVGMIPLNGTSNEEHMKIDLETDQKLTADEIKSIETVGFQDFSNLNE